MRSDEGDSRVNQDSDGPSPSSVPEVIPVESAESAKNTPPEHTLPVLLPNHVHEIQEVLPAPRPPHPNLWWAILWNIGFIFITQIVGGFVGLMVIVFWGIVQAPSAEVIRENLRQREWYFEIVQKSSAALVFVVELFVIVFSLLAVRLVVGIDWKRRLALRRPSATHFILVVLGFPGLVYLADACYGLAKLYLPGMHDFGLSGMEDWTKEFQNWSAIVAVLIIGVGPGIGEELWCRGFLGRGLVGTYGTVFGVLFTSLFFGLIHVDPQQATAAFFMGICLHFVYLTSRSLLLSMFLHFFNNSVSVIWPRDWKDDSAQNIPLILYLGSILLVAAVGWAMYRSRVRLVRTNDNLPPWRPDFPGVEYPPPGTSTVVWRPWPGWQACGLVLASLLIFALSIYLAPQFVIP